MRRIAIFFCLAIITACSEPRPVVEQKPPAQRNRARELAHFDPTMEQLKPNPKPDEILIGCMDVAFTGAVATRTPLPTRIRLTRREVHVNAASVQTWYAVESLDPQRTNDERWIWLPQEGMLATILMGDGFVGWELKVGPAPDGFQGTAAWYSDTAPFRSESAPIRLRRVLCR